jgi:hypothetical protein
MITAMLLAHPVWAQDTPAPAPEGGATSQETVGAAPRAIVRTPGDIARDRDIVPQDGVPREIPDDRSFSRPSTPRQQSKRSKQGNAGPHTD